MGLSWGRKSAAPLVSSPARQDRCKVGGEGWARGADAADGRDVAAMSKWKKGEFKKKRGQLMGSEELVRSS